MLISPDAATFFVIEAGHGVSISVSMGCGCTNGSLRYHYRHGDATKTSTCIV
jgi:hypothetical protein